MSKLKNRVSATLSKEERAEVLAAIAKIKEKLPFLINLANDEIQNLAKMGDQRRGFVNKALEIASQNPEILPRAFDVEEMRKDVELYDDLAAINIALEQLNESVVHTLMVVGSEAYSGSLVVYSQVKDNPLGLALEGAADQLGQRFARKMKSKKVDPAKAES